MSNKQDRAYARTATDLERRYNFGRSFAEVFGLIDGVKKDAEQAVKELDATLNHEEIFNRLTDYGKVQGIYRQDGNVYINASYIKSGTLSADLVDADNLKVKAANITGSLSISQLPDDVAKVSQLPATLKDVAIELGLQDATGVTNIVGGLITTDYINALGISVAAANVTGKLVASQIDATNLKVKAANITGLLVASELRGDEIGLYDSDGELAATFIVNTASTADYKLDINADAIGITTNEGYLYLGSAGGAYLQLVGAYTYSGATLAPDSDGGYDLGRAKWRWNNVYSTNGTIQTSDRYQKKNISYGLSRYEEFFNRLKPSAYQMANGKRIHTGLIAQDIEQLLEECGISTMDFAGFVKSEREDGSGYDYGLRYSEFIPLLIEQVQLLKARVNDLERGGKPNGKY